jgi:hypothetical protein
VSRDFFILFFHKSFSPKPWKITSGSFRFFSKIGDIFASQGAPPVSTTSVADLQPVLTSPVVRLDLTWGKMIHEKT